MFFFLSKTLNYFTAPLLIVCGLLLASWLLKNPKWKKRLFRTGLILLLFFSNDFIANELMSAWEIPVTLFADIKKQYAFGVVLTGVTKSEGGPKDRVYFSRGADRVTHTLQLYKLGIIKKIFITGGSGRLVDVGVREADEMANVLVLMGAKAEDIIIENQSRNTHENALFTVKMLEGKALPGECLLITSAFHMRRSAACFSKLNWKMDMFTTDFLSHERSFSPDLMLIPRVEALTNWTVLIKEWIGILAYKIAGYI